MKHLTKRLLALTLSVAMAATMAPVATVQAAGKKTMTVSTQAELTKALATKGVSKITVKTAKAVKFTVKKGTYSAKLEMNAPKATMTNSGKWASVTVVDAKSFTERAKNNKVVVKDKKLTFTVAKGATVKSVTFAKKGASETVKINGTVSAMTISSPATVKITDNGSLKKVTVDAKAAVTLSGSSDVKAAVTLTKNAKDSSVKSAVPVAVKASADAAITLKEGAEGSTVAVKTADAKVSMTNSTKDTVEVTKANGTRESVAAGEKIDTSDDGKKEDVKKPAAGDSVGGNNEWSGSSGPNVNPPGEEDTTKSLTLSKTEATISLWDGNETIAITAKNIENVEWKSSDEAVVTVNGTKNAGTLIPHKAGIATITVSGDGIQRVCDVTVTNETKTAAGLQKAVDEIAKGTLADNVDLCGDINGDVAITYNGTNDLTINFKSYTVNGNVTITSDKANKIFLTDTNATITGNLTVQAPSSHVENFVTAKDVVIRAVSDTTFVLQDVIKGIVQMMGQGTINVSDSVSKSEIPDIKIDTDKAVKLAGNVKKVEVVKPATITVATTVEKIEIKETAATTDAQKVTIKAGENGQATAIQADAPVEIAVPTTEVVASKPVEVKADITSVYVKSDEATIQVDESKKVSSIAVADSNVTKISVAGKGTVAAMDVTKAESDSVEIFVETATTEIPVITKAEQNITTTTGNVVEKKITGIVAKGDVKEETLSKGSQPVISGEITVTFSGDSESTVDIPVTDQMTLPASKPDSDGWYTIQVTYGGQTCDFLKYKYKEPEIKSAVFDGSAMKTVYKRGETFDPTGAVVTLIYDNGDVKKLTDTSSMEFTWEGTLEQVGKATVSVSKINGITYTGTIDGTQMLTVQPNYYAVDLDLNENGRKLSLPKVTEGAILANLPETSNLATLKPEWPGNSYWTFKRWVTVADRSQVYDFTAPITADVNLIAEWNIEPPAGKQGIKSVIQQTTAQNSQSILQIFTTGDKNTITDSDYIVSVSRNNGETWEVVSPDLYTGFTDEYISWYGIQFKDQSMFFKTADGNEAPYKDAIFKVEATKDGNLVGWGTCTIVSLVDTFAPSVWIRGSSCREENGTYIYRVDCGMTELTTYSYVGVKGDRRSSGKISKDAYDALKSEAIVSGDALQGPTEQGDYSYNGTLSFTTIETLPEEGMTVYYLFWDKYQNYTEALPVYFGKGTSDVVGPNVGIKFSFDNVKIEEYTYESGNATGKKVSTTLQVTSSMDGTYSWLVAPKDLGERFSAEQYQMYVKECQNGNFDNAIQLIQKGTSIQANTLTDVPVSFIIPSDASGDYYIYLIVYGNNGGASPAMSNVNHIQIQNGALVFPETNQGSTDSENEATAAN